MSARPLPATERDPREELSCLLDGELDAERGGACLSGLCRDPRAQSDWALWHAVGDALRSQDVAALHSAGFAARMAQALEAEPAIVAPRALSLRSRTVRRFVLPVTAAAAAAVMLTVVALPMLQAPATTPGTQLAGAVQPPRDARNGGADVLPVAVVDRSPELEAYLQAHREVSGGIGLPRTSHYLRQVSAER